MRTQDIFVKRKTTPSHKAIKKKKGGGGYIKKYETKFKKRKKL